MAIIKLQEAGESHTMRVRSCGEVAGNFGAQVKFDGEDGSTLFLPKDSADRQLARLELGYAQAVGESLTFSRSPNPKPGAKPYWNIAVADVIDRAVPAQSKRLAPPKKPLPFDEESFPPDGPYAPDAQNYPIRQGNMPNLSAPAPTDDDAPEWVTGDIAPKASSTVAPKTEAKLAMARAYLDLLGWVQADKPKLSDEAAQAAAATIWISWGQAGLR